jgi:hypothetical protein
LEYAAGYKPTAVFLNGRGLHNGRTFMHLPQGDIRVDSREPYRLEIRSVHGRLLYSAVGGGTQDAWHRIDPLLKPGLYLVNVSTRKALFTQRVVVR